MVHSSSFKQFAGVLGAGLALLMAADFVGAQAQQQGPPAQDSQARGAEPGTQRGQPGQTALERMRTNDSTGRVKEPGLGEAKIPEPTPLLPESERPVLKRASARAVLPEPEPSPGFINESVLRTQVNQRRRELDTCRPPGSKASLAPMQLRWTIVPGGHVKNTVVMTERQPSSLEVVKCVRKRMDAWVFASPAGGPVDVETTHTFAPTSPRALEKEMTADTSKQPGEPQPALQKARTTTTR